MVRARGRQLAGITVLACAAVTWTCGEAPDEGAARRSARTVLAAVARRQSAGTLADGDYRAGSWEEVSANRLPQGVSWVYPWGVTLYGLLRASEVTGEHAYGDFVLRHNQILGRYHAYLLEVYGRYGTARASEVNRLIGSSSIARLLALGSLDNTGAMTSQMLEGFLQHRAAPTAEQRALVASTAHYITAVQSRLPDGTFWRPERNQTLWIDDLYMSCPFLTRWAVFTGDTRHLDDAARQILGQASRQQDRDGVWFHGNFVAQGRTSPYKWARGNGWAMVATVEVLSVLPDSHALRPQLLDVLRRHITGVEPLQAPSGLWRQVLDHPELWEETSSTAMFTYSIARAVHRGWIGKEHLEAARRGMIGIASQVSTDGRVSGTCEGTSIGTDLAYYEGRRRPLDDPHGPGPVLLAASEILAEQESGK